MDKNPKLVVMDYYLEDYYQNLHRQNQLTGIEMINKIKMASDNTEVIIMSKEKNKKIIQKIAQNRLVSSFLLRMRKYLKELMTPFIILSNN